MTCIVGVTHRSHVWLGGDAAVSDEVSVSAAATPKVWQPFDGCLIGFAGDWVAHTALRWRLEPSRPAPRTHIERWIATELVDAIHRALDAAQCDSADWELLVGFSGREGGLWELGQPGSVTRKHTPYAALGSAAATAYGALAVTDAAPPDTRLRWALEAAVKHCDGVRAPFTILRV